VARYEPAQTRDARRAKENGIWLCQNCGRLVDADAQKFTIEVLTGWKRSAQERAFRISSKESETLLYLNLSLHEPRMASPSGFRPFRSDAPTAG
jgi:hypothetical protein